MLVMERFVRKITCESCLSSINEAFSTASPGDFPSPPIHRTLLKSGFLGESWEMLERAGDGSNIHNGYIS